jgi:hypothetical protein
VKVKTVRSQLTKWLSSIAIVAIVAASTDSINYAQQPEFSRIRKLFDQNKSSFSLMHLRIQSVRGNTDKAVQNEANLLAFRERMISEGTDPEVRESLKSLAIDGKSVDDAKREWILRLKENAEADRILGTAKVETDYFVTPEFLQITSPLLVNDPEMQMARKAGLKSFTGGDWNLYQRNNGEAKWTLLKAYPPRKRSYPVFRTTTRAYFSDVLYPPLINAAHVDCQYLSGINLLNYIEQMAPIGTSDIDGNEFYLYAGALDPTKPNSLHFVACVNTDKGAIPRWISLILPPELSGLKFTDPAFTKDLVAVVERFESADSLPSTDMIAKAMRSLVWFRDVRQVAGAGWYPFETQFAVIRPVRTSPNPKAGLEASEPAIVYKELLTVKEIEVNDAFSKPQPITFPERYSLIDEDTKEESYVGME